jgi:putative spermidine/putrescine transport system ATP-binding protein
VLLLDEPLGALDLKLREEMQVELKAIQREVGITFVFVTHDQDEALTLCDRLAVFRDGRIEQLGTAQQVYQSPATPFVADFVGTSNLIRGEAARAILGRGGTCSIRPERIRVQRRGTTAGADDVVIEAVVREVVYAGAETRIVVDAAHGLTLAAVVLNSTMPTVDVHRGDPVTLCWERAAVNVIEP